MQRLPRTQGLRELSRVSMAGLVRIALGIAIVAFSPRVAFACPVCFGENDSPLALGINYGILAMLGIIVGLWVAFGSFFLYLRRRARMVESGGPVKAGSHLHQTGTV
jgi:hypothetical protein